MVSVVWVTLYSSVRTHRLPHHWSPLNFPSVRGFLNIRFSLGLGWVSPKFCQYFPHGISRSHLPFPAHPILISLMQEHSSSSDPASFCHLHSLKLQTDYSSFLGTVFHSG